MRASEAAAQAATLAAPAVTVVADVDGGRAHDDAAHDGTVSGNVVHDDTVSGSAAHADTRHDAALADAAPDSSERGAADTDLGPAPYPSRRTPPALAAAVLAIIAISVAIGGHPADEPAGPAVAVASSPVVSTATSVVAAPADHGTVVVSTVASTTAPATTAPTTTVPPAFSHLDSAPALLGEPTGLALYAAVRADDSPDVVVQRVDLDTGLVAKLRGVIHGVPRQLVVIGDELVIVDEGVHAVDSTGRDRRIFDEVGPRVVNDGTTMSTVTMVGKQATLHIANVPTGEPAKAIELPDGVRNAFADGLGQVLYEGPGGGVFRLDPANPKDIRNMGLGRLRWAGAGHFEEVTCNQQGADCQVILKNLSDGVKRPLIHGAWAIGFPDPLFRLMVFGSVSPGDVQDHTTVLRLGDNVTMNAPVTLGPPTSCVFGDCVPAQPVWTLDGQWMLTAGDGVVSAWRPGDTTARRLAIGGRVLAFNVGPAAAGPGSGGPLP